MNIREETLKIARNLMKKDPSLTYWVISKFPELKESEDSEDERIIKEMIKGIFKIRPNTPFLDTNVTREEVLSWLEKQGEEIIPLEQVILNVWELGNYWRELTKGFCNTKYGTQLDYIAKHWKEGEHYIKSLKKQGEQKPAWSEEDKKVIDCIEEVLYSHLDYVKEDIRCTKRERKETKENFDKCIDWLKSLRPQNRWKPSEEMLEALYRVIPENVMEKSEDEMLLDRLYQGLKYGKVLSEK